MSTITVHLKLNFDTNAALTQIQSKVAQVRNDMPPEAEAPIINLETADNQFAAMYMGFSSGDLDQNQITDYLTRVVQPRLSAVSGVQRADILGARTFAMRVWLKPDRMAALGISPSSVRDALADNNYLSALGRTKGSMVSVNLVANTDLKTPEEFRQLVVKEEEGRVVRLGEIADVVLGAENYEQDASTAGRDLLGIWVLPPPTPGRDPAGADHRPGSGPAHGGDEGGHPLRLTAYPERHRGGAEDLTETCSSWWWSSSSSWAPGGR